MAAVRQHKFFACVRIEDTVERRPNRRMEAG